MYRPSPGAKKGGGEGSLPAARQEGLGSPYGGEPGVPASQPRAPSRQRVHRVRIQPAEPGCPAPGGTARPWRKARGSPPLGERVLEQEKPDLASDPRDLTVEEALEEAEVLRWKIRRHNYLYYVEARPEISDAAYDELYRRLQALEEAHPSLITPDSPTQRVGAEPREDLPTVAHTAPMLSLDSTKEEAELRRFHDRVRKALGDDVSYLVEPKLDGASLELVYENGLLARAVTRGNGVEGEGVTENVKTIPSVPLRLREEERPVPPLLAVRGEVLMSLSAFEGLNEKLMAEGVDPFANPDRKSVV